MAILKYKNENGQWETAETPGAIKYTEQILTEEQKVQARVNIDASGIYIGSGDMPEGYTIQIDPSGEVEGILTEEHNTDTTAHADIREEISQLSSEIVDIKAESLQQTPLFANSIDECTDTTKLYVLPDGYIYAHMKTTIEGGVAYTNLAEPLPDNTTDTTKWVNGYRIGSSGLSAQTGKTITNPIEGTVGDIFYVKNVNFVSGGDRVVFTSDPNTSGQYAYVSQLPNEYWGYEYVDGVHAFTILKVGNPNSKYFRCCFDTPADPSMIIITKNEEIIDNNDVIETYAWTNTGHAFVPADYEDRIIGLENKSETQTKNINKLQDRITAIENGTSAEIPTYWQEHLTEKISTIKALQNAGGKDCFSFVFITDVHYPSNLGKCSPALAKKIVDECNIRFVLNGGDNQTRGCYQTKEEILLENKQLKEMFAPIKDKLLQVEGNHDGSYYWSGGTVGSGTPYVKQLTEQEMFEEYYRANGLNGDVHFDENSNAFYVDDVSNKVRYIGLNSMNVPNSKTDVNADGTAKYTKFHNYQFLQAQYDFLCNEALVTVPSDAWSVVVFGHSGIYNSGDYTVMVDVLSAYKNKTECVAEYAGTEAGGPAYTNLAEPLPNNTTDTTKWVNGYRIGSTGYSTQSGKSISNPVDVELGDVIYVKNVNFVSSGDRFELNGKNGNGGDFEQRFYVSALPNSVMDYELVDGVHKFTVLYNVLATNGKLRFSFDTPTNPDDVIITVNQPIVESEYGYDYVSVNHDFAEAKGKFVAYFHGHDHKDADYTRDSIKDISTRCDGVEEHDEADRNVREAGKITEQSFDVFTVNKSTNTIYATKIGAGIDRELNY